MQIILNLLTHTEWRAVTFFLLRIFGKLQIYARSDDCRIRYAQIHTSLRNAGRCPSGIIAGLKFIEYRWLVAEHSIEIYGALVAAAFAAFGIWLGLRFTQRTKIVGVREVMVDTPVEFVRDQEKLASLGHAAMYLIFATAFGLTLGFNTPFIFFCTIGWGIGVIVHGLNAFEIVNIYGPPWETKQIEKRLGRPL